MDRPDSVVIVVDLQTGMFDGLAEPPVDDAKGLEERTRSVLAWARRTGRKVAFVRHDGPSGDPLAPGRPGWPVWPALGQAEDEPTFSKSVGDAFSNPALGGWVDGAGARSVVVLGAQTDHCIAATVSGALARGLAVTVVSDAHSTSAFGAESVPAIVERHNRQFAAMGATVVETATLVAE
ncbi:MAG: isochorismatase family protein [Caulobacteraceae bacterium]